MITDPDSAKIAALQRRLAEAEETLRAIHEGEVDAVLVQGPGGERVYTLETADRPYRLMVERMQEGALTLGLDRTIYYCNAHFAEMLGTTVERVVGRRLDEFTPEDQLGRLAEIFGSDSSAHAQLTLGIDRKRLPVKLSVATVEPAEEGSWCVVVTDLAEQKEREKLVDDHRRKDQFIATLAHELRNPLAPIGYAVEVLRTGVGSGEAARPFLDVIERQVEHLRRLVDDLLDVARITRGAIHLERSIIDLRSILRNAAETAHPLLEEHHHEFRLALGSDPVMVDADPVRLAQVFENLLTNAAKYTPPGGLVEVRLARSDAWAKVAVKDTGTGIAPDFQPRLFQVFEQADRTLDRAHGGLGLGLALVKRLVEMHGGSVSAESRGQGCGSTFRVELPVAVEQTAAVSAQAAGKEGCGKGQRVLVVEDNRDAAAMLAMLLEREGHEVHVAYDGADALVAAHQVRPQIVILDIGLPGLDGFEVARRLRGEIGEAIQLVAVTGYGQEEYRVRTGQAGFDRHLVKPVSLGDLRSLFATPSR